jgi:spermidine synthase
MGATLPVLAQFLVRSKNFLGRTAGRLYAVNTFGAVCGAAATGFFLLPALGLMRSNWIAVAGNLSLGALAIFFGRRKFETNECLLPGGTEKTPLPEARNTAEITAAVSPLALKAAVLTFGLTGFAAMATQIGWTRAISLGTGSSTYAFSLIVSIFILGLGVGGIWGARVAPRHADPLALLGQVLLLIGLLCLAVASLLGYSPVFFFYLLIWGGAGESGACWSWLLTLQALGIALLIIAPTVLMGATMPLTMQVAARTNIPAGRTVGNIYAVNTLGSILGSFFGGLFLLPALQIHSTLEIMALFYALPGLLLFCLSSGGRRLRMLLPTCGIVVLVFAMELLGPAWDPAVMSSGSYLLRLKPANEAAQKLPGLLREKLLGRLEKRGAGSGDDFDLAFKRAGIGYGYDGRKVLYYREGAEATVAVSKIFNNISLSVGGKPDASSQGDMSTQIGLTLIPELLHAKGPEEVLVIGLGSGVSAGAALAPSSVKRVDVVEMSPEVVAASSFFCPFNRLGYNCPEPPAWLNTPGLELIINDGRNHLLLTNRFYDVIASEPSNPWIAGVGNLFTKEAFLLAKARLKPGGVMCQWLHNYALAREDFYAIVRTFGEVFEHLQLWWVSKGDFLLVGSDSPLVIKVSELRARLRQPAVKAWLGRVNFDSEYEFLANFICCDPILRSAAGHVASRIHTDDNLLLEFSAPRALYARLPIFDDYRFPLMPENILAFTGLSLEERSEFMRQLDLAVAARGHLNQADSGYLCALQMKVAHQLAPNQYWAAKYVRECDETMDKPCAVDNEEAARLLKEERQLYKEGRVDEALTAAWGRICSLAGSQEALHNYCALALLGAGKLPPSQRLPVFQDARRLAQEACVLFPETPANWESLCRIFLVLEKLDKDNASFQHYEAQQAYHRLLELRADDLSKVPPDLGEKCK